MENFKKDNKNIIEIWLDEKINLTIQDCFVLGNLFFSNNFENDIKFIWKKDKLFEDKDEFDNKISYDNINKLPEYKTFLISFFSNDDKYFGLIENLKNYQYVNNINFNYSFENEFEIDREIFISTLRKKIKTEEQAKWFLRGIFDNRGSVYNSKITFDIGLPIDVDGKKDYDIKSRIKLINEFKKITHDSEIFSKLWNDFGKINLSTIFNHKGAGQKNNNDQLRLTSEIYFGLIGTTNKMQLKHYLKKFNRKMEASKANDFFNVKIEKSKEILREYLSEEMIDDKSYKNTLKSKNPKVHFAEDDLQKYFVKKIENKKNATRTRTDEDVKKNRDISDISSRKAEELVYEILKSEFVDKKINKEFIDNANAGYDISIEDENGIFKMYEVKKYEYFNIEMSINEFNKANENCDIYNIALVKEDGNVIFFNWKDIKDLIETKPLKLSVILRG